MTPGWPTIRELPRRFSFSLPPSNRKAAMATICVCPPSGIALDMSSDQGILFHRLSMGLIRSTEPDFLPGTLEMLILQTLKRGANHGYGIAQHIQQISNDALKIGEGSLYPALQRLLMNDYVVGEWGFSENNRRARFYKITATGRKQLSQEKRKFKALLAGIARVMETP